MGRFEFDSPTIGPSRRNYTMRLGYVKRSPLILCRQIEVNAKNFGLRDNHGIGQSRGPSPANMNSSAPNAIGAHPIPAPVCLKGRLAHSNLAPVSLFFRCSGTSVKRK
jgi:hypothetical protein